MAVENGEEDGRDGKRRKVYDDESGEFVAGDATMEGLKQEVTSLGEWIKEEIRDRNTERDESERDADDVAEGMGMEE